MVSHRKVCKKWLLIIIRGKSISVCLPARKVKFNIRSRKCDHVTSDNLDDFKTVYISNISVSFVEKRFRCQWWRYLKQHLFIITLESGLTTSILFPIRTPPTTWMILKVKYMWLGFWNVGNTLIAMVGYWARCTDTGERMTLSKI